MKKNHFIKIFLFLCFWGCNSPAKYPKEIIHISDESDNNSHVEIDTTFKTIHIFVSLCDNQYQGIVPVPAKIGNGQDPDNNLYWGCGFGVRTYFMNSKEWKFIKSRKADSLILERIVFKHINKNFYLIADAYDGQYIKQCTDDFLKSSCGHKQDTLILDQKIIGISGNSRLVAYVGHNGLMDYQLTETFRNNDSVTRDVMILACYSRSFFLPHLQSTKINPIIWTTGLMAPEAYTIHDAITGYVNQETNESIRARAALAYANHQNCSEKTARRLIVTGW